MSKEKLPMRVGKGCLTPADRYTEEKLRSRKYKLGDIVFCQITKPRNPKFNNLVHRFGEIVASNIESFEGMEPHAVLKRLQVEGNIGCDEVMLNMQGMNLIYRIPKSLSFESMDQNQFSDVYRQFCLHIQKTYWPTLSVEEIEEMAELMPEDI